MLAVRFSLEIRQGLSDWKGLGRDGVRVDGDSVITRTVPMFNYVLR